VKQLSLPDTPEQDSAGYRGRPIDWLIHDLHGQDWHRPPDIGEEQRRFLEEFFHRMLLPVLTR